MAAARALALARAGADARLVHQRAHAPDRRLQSAEDRLADQEVADVELDDLRDAGDGADGVEGQPVPGMHLEAGGRRGLRGALAAGRSSRATPAGVVLERALAIGARVQLHDVGAEPRRRLDRPRHRAR